jgi:hypothetical protein
VGVAIGSWDHYQDDAIITRKWYLDPGEPIYPFITELTGITDEDIQTHAVSHQQLATELYDLCTEHVCYKNFVTWGGGDFAELKAEFDARGVAFRFGGHRWIDVKTWYTLYMLSHARTPNGGLASAMAQFKLRFQGEAHRADVDALNTLKLFFAILDRQSRLEYVTGLARKITP